MKEFIVPGELIVQTNPPQTMLGKVRGFELTFKPEVAQWCKENKVKIAYLLPEIVFGKMVVGPFRCRINNDTKAILFKMRWF